MPVNGTHTLKFHPYNAPHLPWLHACIEVDPEETIGSWPDGLSCDKRLNPLNSWTEPEFWERCRSALVGDCAFYADAFAKACLWAGECTPDSDPRRGAELNVPILIAGAHLGHCPDGIAEACKLIDHMIAKEHWGNPCPDAYAHNGDMGAGLYLMTLAMAYHMLGNRLGTDRKQRLVAKCRLQGQRFFQLMLLNRDYWGGALLQDHGWRSTWIFANACLHLLGVIPEAELWIRMLIPRIRRALNAMPLDGHVPPSSYNSTHLYLHELTLTAWTFQALGGSDFTDHQPLNLIADYIWGLMPGCEQLNLSNIELPHVRLNGGTSLFNWQAARDGNRQAAALHRLFIAGNPKVDRPALLHHARFWSFFMHQPQPVPAELPKQPQVKLHLCPDSATACFVDDKHKLQVKLSCGPWCGYNAYRSAAGPCDRMRMQVSAGSFSLSRGTKRLIGDAPSAYFLHTAAGSTWLIDGSGQRGDIGYPMSIPSCPDWGEEIIAYNWDSLTDSGWLLLDLRPAYPEALGIIKGTRKFYFTSDAMLTVVDQLVFSVPRQVCWLFQTPEDNLPRIDGSDVIIASQLRITPVTDDKLSLSLSLQPTFQVFSYSSICTKYQHARYEAPRRQQLTVAFNLSLNE